MSSKGRSACRGWEMLLKNLRKRGAGAAGRGRGVSRWGRDLRKPTSGVAAARPRAEGPTFRRRRDRAWKWQLKKGPPWPCETGGRPAVHFAAAPNASDDGRRSHRCTRARCGWCGPFTFSQKYLITIIHPPSPICRPERSVQRELSCAGCLASRPEWRTLSAVRAGRGFVTGGNRYPAGRRERRGARLTRREEGAYATRRPVRPLRSASFSCSCSATGQPESGR